ncbi:hypothetical protein EJ04DRAFT_517621 [Polyplosphaeria fusca]|uniref:Uncharacterized protein n=1 Tax=Polyplosphaeria fusca TaxID=682080 RepID=A0A9P4QL29_9PLEO|nr:hypothetical protein EJ04DRAFT_517621 [Polyplosphaeria fusca]
MSRNTSATSTPSSQSRRASVESTRSDRSEKHHKSMKQMWTSFKKAAVEHHRSVNAAYAACYGQGMRMHYENNNN